MTMRYYLAFVLLGLLMAGVCVVLEVHTTPSALATVGLFGANEDDGEQGDEDSRAAGNAGAALPA
jgi:hypothetical protein